MKWETQATSISFFGLSHRYTPVISDSCPAAASITKCRGTRTIMPVHGKGGNTMFRRYGPLETWFDKAWKTGEIELVQ